MTAHIIPTAERGDHDPDLNCACRPELATARLPDGLGRMARRPVIRHRPAHEVLQHAAQFRQEARGE